MTNKPTEAQIEAAAEAIRCTPLSDHGCDPSQSIHDYEDNSLILAKEALEAAAEKNI